MKLSKTLTEAINNQIAMELHSSYLYLGMSAYCESQNFPGAAKWLRAQSHEETGHAMKLFDYLYTRDAKAELMTLAAPPAAWKSLRAVFDATLKHEQTVTASIQKLHDLAVKEKDTAAQILLQWYITEQVEEEKNVTDILAKFDMIGDSPMGLMFLDKQLGERG
ncbi:MAG: ferritin [bacterium]|nr:ferritin [Candidatus Sumerlaeota bacterium]